LTHVDTAPILCSVNFIPGATHEEEHGFYGVGECITIADPDEAWAFECFGPGAQWTLESGEPGAVWAAQRIPDDEFFISANRATVNILWLPQTCSHLQRRRGGAIAVAVSHSCFMKLMLQIYVEGGAVWWKKIDYIIKAGNHRLDLIQSRLPQVLADPVSQYCILSSVLHPKIENCRTDMWLL